ncbi:hypothetical protein D3C75_1332060 [compost metagenome]
MTVLLITTKKIFSQGEEKIILVINKHRKLLEGLESRDPAVISVRIEEYFADSHQTIHLSIQ